MQQIKAQEQARRACTLFLSVLLGMSLSSLFSMHSGVKLMASRYVCMVCRLLVTSGLVMLGRVLVVPDGVHAVF